MEVMVVENDMAGVWGAMAKTINVTDDSEARQTEGGVSRKTSATFLVLSSSS